LGSFAAGSVILVTFPFSDLSQAKLRPALVIADCGGADWLLCQITSNPFADPRAIELRETDFIAGSLRVVSYGRPGKLFTAHRSLIVSQVGALLDSVRRRIADAIIELIRTEI
jgi:mRNA interferase MazF